MNAVHGGRLGLLACSLLAFGCGSSTEVVDEEKTKSAVRGPEWVESSHGNLPSDTVAAFPANIRTFVLAMPETTWVAMQASLNNVCGALGAGAACSGSLLDASPTVAAWHCGSVFVDGQTWASVGFRLRSNSDLADAWTKGTLRFPFRLTFDKWEDRVPAIKNQRFYGFKKLSLTSLSSDSSALRHQVASAVYRAQGVPALQGAVVQLKLVRGTDTLSMGLYALREVSDGPILSRWFASGSGNLYEPSSSLGSYVNADFSEGENDGTHTDVVAFLGALNSSTRISDPVAWRESLRKVFDVDRFVRWMAVSQALGDHGSYGRESGNYGLYGLDGKIRWMALDLDKTFPEGASRSRGVWYPGTAGSWPLIEKVLADSAFCQDYVRELRALTTTGDASADHLSARIRQEGMILSSDPASDVRVRPLLDFAAQRAMVVDTSIANHPCPRKE